MPLNLQKASAAETVALGLAASSCPLGGIRSPSQNAVGAHLTVSACSLHRLPDNETAAVLPIRECSRKQPAAENSEVAR